MATKLKQKVNLLVFGDPRGLQLDKSQSSSKLKLGVGLFPIIQLTKFDI